MTDSVELMMLRKAVTELLATVTLGTDMRMWQARYFKAKRGTPAKDDALQHSLRAERVFDQAARVAVPRGLEALGTKEPVPPPEAGGGHAEC